MNLKRGQITIFIIIGIFLVAGTILFFTFRESIGLVQIPANLQPAYNKFISCIEEDILVGIDVLGSQGGYIYPPEFEPGSSYMPFSSQLNFLGNSIPYWYYVSGNNIQKEQVPSRINMEEDLSQFLSEDIRGCNFDTFYEQGFEITLGEPQKIESDINSKDVKINIRMPVGLTRGEDTVVLYNHKIEVSSELGKLYDSARKVHEFEQEKLFLEEYAIDNLRLYAPVDGVELSCSPLTWNAEEIFDDLEDAIEANTLALNVLEGENDYFILDLPINEEVRFINSKEWPNGFEVNPADGPLLISSPIGDNHPALGVLGFCYTPYHYVYDMKYPVLIQIIGEEETFQFPTAVVIKGNNPREPLEGASIPEIEVPQLCEQQNIPVTVNVLDTSLNPIDAEISYKCSGSKCDIGKTQSGTLLENFPQCVNGFITAEAPGYKSETQMYSIVSEESIELILDKLYDLEIDLTLDNQEFNEQATISFISNDSSRTIVYPDQKRVNLSVGQYEIQVYVYKNSTIRIGKTTTRRCVETPDSGIGGFFGFTQEKCFNLDFPEQIISNSLGGGGKQNYYILESELENSNFIEINAGSLPKPSSLQQLQDNYILFEDKNLNIGFR